MNIRDARVGQRIRVWDDLGTIKYVGTYKVFVAYDNGVEMAEMPTWLMVEAEHEGDEAEGEGEQ